MRRATLAAILVGLVSVPARTEPSFDDPLCPPNPPFPTGPFNACEWTLRPDTDEWLPLLAPPGQTVLGTSGPDALSASGAGDVVDGLSGNDVLTSGFDRTALIGRHGNDELSTDALASTTGLLRAFEVQLGGPGHDTHRASLGVEGLEASGELLIDLGAGDDTVEARSYIEGTGTRGENTFNGVSNQIYGRTGDDVIDAVADAQGYFEDSLALNAVDGGDGHDHITVRAITEHSGEGASAHNRVDGGGGDDFVDATLISWPQVSRIASNVLLGGSGNDVIRAFCRADTNSSTTRPHNELWGGNGNDELDLVLVSSENFFVELTTVLDGGKGNDRLHVDAEAEGEHMETLHELSGGAGDDELSLVLDLAISAGHRGNDSQIFLEGGPGRDRLEASVTATPDRDCDEPPCDFIPRAQNHLDGGSMGDVLVASVGADVIGASFLAGGGGDDELTVTGGSGNELDGGNGKDSLFAGDGDERLTGGEHRDTYYFDLADDQGSDTIADFEPLLDVLRFAGITDQGAPGLADDLDAISTFTDLGPANGVVIDLASGSQILFAGRGTGEVDSWAELAPPQALKPWEGAL